MLTHLSIRDFTLIDQLDLELEPVLANRSCLTP